MMTRFLKYCFVGLLFIQMTACVDQEFDAPPGGREIQETDISNTTIKELKDTHELGQALEIATGTIIKGRVISDDTRGNFFRELIIQDETAGILIRLDKTSLAADYELGRIVYVNCDGLNIGDFAGLIQIGYPGEGANIDRIPEIFVEDHLTRGALPSTPVEATPVTIGQLNDNFLSTLVVIQDAQFEEGELGQSIAIPNGGGSTNRGIEDCEGDEITLRSSDFSDFAGFAIPMGNGTLTGVYSKFVSTAQITVRSPEDFSMSEERCGDGGGGGGTDVDISNTTVADLKAMHTIGSNAIAITDDLIIKGTVISDDTEGNFFKELVIQDETGGILIRIDAFDINEDYPVGQEVFIRCAGLGLGDFGGLPQLGIANGDGGVDRIDGGNVGNFVVKGLFKGGVTPTVVTLSGITSDMLNTLIQINDVEFADSELGNTLAIAGNGGGQNRSVRDCDGGSIIMRNSDFSDFADTAVPEGNGSIVAVANIFNDFQLKIRDVNDLNLNGSRCSGGGGGGTGDLVTIASLKDAFQSGTTVGGEGFVEGVVISDFSTANIQNRNLVLQDASGGIIVRLPDPHTFALGQSLRVTTTGAELSEFNGGFQILPSASAVTSLGAGTLPEPRVTTVSELMSNFEAWESTLVKIEMAAITGGSTFADANEISDATGAISTFVFNGSTFSGESLPTGEVAVTGIVSEFNAQQITLRNSDDVEGGSTGGGGGGGTGGDVTVVDLRDLFASGTNSAPDGMVEGVVISDYTTGTVNENNLHLQGPDGGGIVVRFTDTHSIPLGTQLTLNVGGTELSEFNGLLQLNNVDFGQIESQTVGALPTPQTVTFADIIANLETLESTLVTIENVSFDGSGTYSGFNTMSDGTGTLGMFIRDEAAFAGNDLPSGNFTVTAIVTQFNDAQIIIRDTDDIN